MHFPFLQSESRQHSTLFLFPVSMQEPAKQSVSFISLSMQFSLQEETQHSFGLQVFVHQNPEFRRQLFLSVHKSGFSREQFSAKEIENKNSNANKYFINKLEKVITLKPFLKFSF